MEGTSAITGTSSNRIWLWIVGALVVIAVLGGTATFLLWPRAEDPATVIPAKEVEFFLRGATKEAREPFERAFPALHGIPDGSPESALVLLKHAGKEEWMLFEPRHTRAESLMQGESSTLPWGLRSSSSAPELLLVKEESLATFVPYTVLKTVAPRGTSWAFMDGKRLLTGAPLSVLDGWMRTVIHDAPFLLVSLPPRGLRVTLYGTAGPLHGGFPRMMDEEWNDLTLSLSDPQAAASFLRNLFSKEQAVIVEGLARAWAQKWLRSDDAVNSALLPLMKYPMSLAVARSATGSTLLPVLALSQKDPNAAAEALKNISDGFKNTLPQGAVRQWKFENRFNARVLFPDAESIITNDEHVGDVTIRTVGTADGTYRLSTAADHAAAWLSADATLLRDALQRRAGSGSGIPLTPGTVAHGSVRLPLFRHLLNNVLGIEPSSVLFPGSLVGDDRLLWQVERHMGMTAVEFRIVP